MSPGDLLGIVGETCGGIVRALRVRIAALPPDTGIAPTQGEEPVPIRAERIARVADAVVTVLLFWHPGRCYYRCYALASVLRSRGVPVTLNLGLPSPGAVARDSGHCWLSLRGRPYRERVDPEWRFRHFLAERGAVRYWRESPATEERGGVDGDG